MTDLIITEGFTTVKDPMEASLMYEFSDAV